MIKENKVLGDYIFGNNQNKYLMTLKEVQEIINDILSLVSNAWADCAVKAFQEHEDKEARAWRRVSLIEAALILMMCIYRLIEVL